MNDQQLLDALRAIGSRPAQPDPDFAEHLWGQLGRARARHHLAIRRELLVAAALLLLALALAIGVGSGLRQDRRGLVIATPTPTVEPTATVNPTVAPTLDVAALLGPWQPTPIAVPVALQAEIGVACREDWFETDQTFGREHRGPEYVAALLDARGEGTATMVFRDPDWQLNFCRATLTADGELESVDMATFGDQPMRLNPTAMQFGPAWSNGSGDPESPITAFGPVGKAGLGIVTATMESAGHPTVTVSVANGAWTFWVPWDWESDTSTIRGFDAEGEPVAALLWP